MECVTIKNCTVYYKKYSDVRIYPVLDVNIDNICTINRVINNGLVEETRLTMADRTFISFNGNLIQQLIIDKIDKQDDCSLVLASGKTFWKVIQPEEQI